MPDSARYLLGYEFGRQFVPDLSKTDQRRAAKDEIIRSPRPEKFMERAFQVNRTEFIALLAECATVSEAYFREAEKTAIMLGKCTQRPLTFDERFALLSQEILERDAYLMYLDAKRLLHSAALLGYGGLTAI
jgi:hypothetical protein